MKTISLKLLKLISSILMFCLIFLAIDIITFKITPYNIKEKIFNKRAHKILSYYYHHDLRPNSSFYDNWGNNKYLIHTNDYGFKDKKKQNLELKDKNILFIGDSLVEGVGVKFEDTFVGKLQELYNTENVSISNASLQSYSISIYLAKIYDLIERKKLKFNHVVLMFTANDVHDDYYRYGKVDKKFKLKHEDEKNFLILHLINFIKGNTFTYQFVAEMTPPKAGINKIKNLIKNIFEKKKAENDLSKSTVPTQPKISNNAINQIVSRKDYEFLYDNKKYEAWGTEAIENSLVTFERLINFLNSKNIKLSVIYPAEAPFLLKKPNESLFNKFIDTYVSFFEENNVNFYLLNQYHVDYSDKKQAYENLFFIGDVHWNIEGHHKIFKEIKNKINF